MEKVKQSKSQKTLTETKESLEKQSINKTYEIRKSKKWIFQDLASEAVDWEIFDTRGKLKYRKEPSIYGGSGARDVYFELCDLVYKTQGNTLAVRREYLIAMLERVDRTIRDHIDTLSSLNFIKAIKNKRGFVYVALKDWRQIMEEQELYRERDFVGRTPRPLPYFREALKVLKGLAKHYMGKKFRIKGSFALDTEDKLFRLKSPALAKMKAYNDVFLEFSPVDAPNLTYTLSYAQITQSQLPSFEALYRKGIIHKRLDQALSRRCLEINQDFLAS